MNCVLKYKIKGDTDGFQRISQLGQFLLKPFYVFILQYR